MRDFPCVPAPIVALFVAGAIAIGWLAGSPMNSDRPTIGIHDVPGHLDCEEDEIIGFDMVGHNLTCLER